MTQTKQRRPKAVDKNTIAANAKSIKEPKVSFTELERNKIYANDRDQLLRFLGYGESIETGYHSAIFQVSKKSKLAVIESAYYYHCDLTSGLHHAPMDVQSINQ